MERNQRKLPRNSQRNISLDGRTAISHSQDLSINCSEVSSGNQQRLESLRQLSIIHCRISAVERIGKLGISRRTRTPKNNSRSPPEKSPAHRPFAGTLQQILANMTLPNQTEKPAGELSYLSPQP